MPQRFACHLIVDPPASGTWNMALDEALLESVAETQVPVLRIYRWQHPTLSLGYFQKYVERQSHSPSTKAAVVRRQSGGGAILHDQELTYSLVVPTDHPLAGDTQALYDTAHRALIDWLTQVAASQDKACELVRCKEAPEKVPAREQPFLCFERRCAGDVLLVDRNPAREHKIAGSAQRRRRGGVLQHGSVVWNTSTFAPEICGFAQLTGIRLDLTAAATSMTECLPSLMGFDCEQAVWSEKTLRIAEYCLHKRHEQLSWIERR